MSVKFCKCEDSNDGAFAVWCFLLLFSPFFYKNGCYNTEYCIICTVTDGYNVWVPVYHCVYAGWYVLMCVCVCVYAYVGGGGWAVVCWLQL